MSDGTVYIDYRTVRDLDISHEYIEREKSRQLQEIERRYALYALKKPQEAYVNTIYGQRATTTILVDDGAASGATMIAAARSVRKTIAQNSKFLIIAVPVSPRDTVNNLLTKEADYVEVVTKPSFFTSVGQYRGYHTEVIKKNRHMHA
jgi:putative phosphoribosyl transferase